MTTLNWIMLTVSQLHISRWKLKTTPLGFLGWFFFYLLDSAGRLSNLLPYLNISIIQSITRTYSEIQFCSVCFQIMHWVSELRKGVNNPYHHSLRKISLDWGNNCKETYCISLEVHYAQIANHGMFRFLYSTEMDPLNTQKHLPSKKEEHKHQCKTDI